MTAPSSQTRGSAHIPALIRFIPGLALFRDYRSAWLLSDILAGISVCVVMIPSVIAYAGLMGLPPQHGLYAALVPLIVYAFFGSSRQVIVGPDIAISLLIASAIGPLANGNPARAATLAAVVALLSGLLLLLGARVKIGAVADFLSKPVLVGYMTGAALILMASQVNKVFAISLKNNDFFPRLGELALKLNQTHWRTLAFGFGLLALLIVIKRIAPKSPAALFVCIVAVIASIVFHLDRYGIDTVGKFPSGLPKFSIPDITWADIHALFPAAIGIALLTYTEGILLARAFAAKNSYEVNPNQELVGLGLADVLSSFFQGFAVTGSQARTTLNDSAGGKTQLASLVAAGTLALSLLFLTPLMAQLPVVTLAVILIYAGFGLVEFDAMKRIYRFYPKSAMISALTTIGVLAAGVIPGILIGVALSLLGLINRVSHPHDAVLSSVPGHGFHDLGDLSRMSTIPGLIAYRFYAPLLFPNAGHFVTRIRSIVAASPTPIRWFLLDAQAITDIDVTAAEALHALNAELRQKGIALKIAHANPPLRIILQKIGFASEISEESFYPSVHECIASFQSGPGRDSQKPTSPPR
jgi:SulP family sulfate permease